MFSFASLLRAPKLLSCVITEEAVSSASTASGKLTPSITTITLRLRRNGPAVSYDLRLHRDTTSGKLFLNDIPDFIANHSVALSTFFPIDGVEAPKNALCVTTVNGEALQALSAKQLQNVFKKGNDLTLQLTANAKMYGSYYARRRRARSVIHDDDADDAPRPSHHKKVSKNKKKKANRKAAARARVEHEEDAEEEEDQDDDDEDDEDDVVVRKSHKKSKKSQTSAKKKTKAAARRNDRKRTPHSGKRTVDEPVEEEEDESVEEVDNEEEYDDDEERSRPTTAKKHKAKKLKKSHKKKNKTKKTKKPKARPIDMEIDETDESGEWPDESEEDALINKAMLTMQKSIKSNRTVAAEEDEEDAWFRSPSSKKATPGRATVQF